MRLAIVVKSFRLSQKLRAENNVGQTVFGDYLYFFDEDLTEVIALYDTNSEDFIAVQEIIEEFVKN